MKPPWSLKKNPDGSYESYNGRVRLFKKGPRWVVDLDGKEHEIKSRSPSFGHLEFILKRELGREYERAVQAAYDYDRSHRG